MSSNNPFAKFELKGTTCYYSIYSGNKCTVRFVKYSKLEVAPDKTYKGELETDSQFMDRVKLIAKG